ncbi:MAG: hypothetical protein LKI34_07770 [Bifidobacterium tibiigranuli]|nr:hypothetical protein [Bifidobacterium tibiigranuli]
MFVPPVPSLQQGLQYGHSGDPGAAAIRQQRGQGGQRREVGDLIQREQQGRVKPGTGRARRHTPRGLDEIIHQGRGQCGGGPNPAAGRQKKQSATFSNEDFGVEVLAQFWRYGVEDSGVGQ